MSQYIVRRNNITYLTDMDKEIINLIESGECVNNQSLAQRLKVHPVVISKRVWRLYQEKVISVSN